MFVVQNIESVIFAIKPPIHQLVGRETKNVFSGKVQFARLLVVRHVGLYPERIHFAKLSSRPARSASFSMPEIIDPTYIVESGCSYNSLNVGVSMVEY